MATGLLAGKDESTRGFHRIVALLIYLVIVPTALLLLIGILMLVLGEHRYNLIFGILVVTLVGCLVTGGVLSLVFLRRQANLSKLQLDFVSKVSHELRTPLTSIRMFVEMLQQDEGRDPEETALCLGVLQKETIRLTDRIERLLDWGRMEAGRRVYDLKYQDPRGVVEKALAAFDATNVGRKVDVEVEFADSLPLIRVDGDAIVDALVNLLSNAVKYSEDQDGIRVKVSATATQLKIAVSDEGVGIPRLEQDRIFQKFYRVDERWSREVEGSGLGLAIVRHVVQGHRGKVEVDSEPGVGSTFTLRLPIPHEERSKAA